MNAAINYAKYQIAPFIAMCLSYIMCLKGLEESQNIIANSILKLNYLHQLRLKEKYQRDRRNAFEDHPQRKTNPNLCLLAGA
jgi:hypothetical protein